ncbi:CaiB/BaiF CoA transferase family protein [Papillibacter cinnamivorans]|uniref:Formyl-CoA transferase n=1 Tax=Papillibacter cinnamivorans DSM 12816 TaxID=1122930 RepID=A0A1W2C9I7_9FIRM|nr:CaiB/BaiF CoA-transferase family protein [Papillibacter cinnamivorans]SMC81801.1 formyl-CoA transferase [Papillibacter cinnamivorans DSM 12816]
MANIFDGVLVIDFSNNLAAPTAVSMLADYGAEVIKIEKASGDDNRQYGPFIEGKSLIAMWLNRNKKSIVMDTRKPEAIEIIKKFIAQADVVVESFKPGAINKMGFGYEELIKIKPDLIMCSVSGFGQDGPYGQRPGYDMIAVAMSGLMDNTGFPDGPPTKIGSAVGDFVGGLDAFGAMAAALYHKAKTGEGQYIDISLLEGLVNINDYTDLAYNNFPVPHRGGNHQAVVAPFGLFNGRDGSIIICVASDKLWAALCTMMGREEMIDDSLYRGSGKRAERKELIIPMIEDWLKSFESVEEPLKLMTEKEIPCCKVEKTQDLVRNEQLIARNMIVDMETKEITAGKIKTRAPVFHFSKTPGKVRFSPALGEHTDEILKKYAGCGDAEIASLKEKGIVR